MTVHPRVVCGNKPLTLPRKQFTVGSFGFGTPSKCFDHVVQLVKREFDKATIRFNIPAAAFGDSEAIEARKIAETCKQLVAGTGITLDVNHEFLTAQQLVDFLGENTINMFCYTSDRGRGLSSAVDFAVASGRPFAVSDGTMFRHLRHVCPEVFISKHGIRGVLEYGAEPVNRLRSLWSDENLVKSFRDAARNAIDAFRNYAVRDKLFNVALDNIERSRYARDIDEMTDLVPDRMCKKIAEANVQQAFVKSAVEHFSGGRKDLRILCVGSFEDTAYETLIAKGYSITAIDPAVDMDLSTFYALKTTSKASFDIIFSTSVIEHVEDDELFISEISSLLAVGGVALLTADFNNKYSEGDVKPYTDYRLYTIKDILLRLVPLMQACELVGPHFWQRSSPDFTFEGAHYSFISLVFRRNSELQEEAFFAQDLRVELLESAVEVVPRMRSEQAHLKSEVTMLKEALRSEIAAHNQVKSILVQGAIHGPQAKDSRLMRLLWNVRNQLADSLHYTKSAGRYILSGLKYRWKRTTSLTTFFISDVAQRIKKRRSSAATTQAASSEKCPTSVDEISSPVPAELSTAARLGNDYGMQLKEWLAYQESLLRSVGPVKGLANQRKGKLWICMSAIAPSVAIDWQRLSANIDSLEQKAIRPLGFVLIDMTTEGPVPVSESPKVTVVNELQTIYALMTAEDSILFIDANDILEPEALRMLEDQGALAADFALFDFYYVDDSRAYPIFLHGVDALHCTHCDYFFSRFLVSSRLIKQEAGKSASLSLRDAAVACIGSADPRATVHIPIPLLQASLERRKVFEAKAAAPRPRTLALKTDKVVSAIICTKNNHFLLRQLVLRLRREQAINDIIVVSNKSSSPGMLSLLDELSTRGDARVLEYNKQFNFSEQSNLGTSIASGESFLFLNDDITPVNDDWLNLLIESGTWNGGSIAGPLLIYPDQKVQHAGMFLGFNNGAGHYMRFAEIPDETSGFGLHAPRNVACVTGAAMLVPRAVFEALNGFDVALAYYLQDVDFCMRASGMGLDVVFDPRSVLIHFESVSVKPILNDAQVNYTRQKEFAYFRRRWPILKDNWLNRNYSPQDETMRSLWCPVK